MNLQPLNDDTNSYLNDLEVMTPEQIRSMLNWSWQWLGNDEGNGCFVFNSGLGFESGK